MEYQIAELIDTDRVQKIMESFYEMTNITCTLVDPEGTILKLPDGKYIGAGWRAICLDFHKQHPESLAKCVRSDTILARQIKDSQKYSIYQCLNGLVDAAFPIYVEGSHVVSLFMGQFFLAPPDIDFFRRQAAYYGFNTEGYLAALGEIPVIDKMKLEQVLLFFGSLGELIALISYKSKKLLDLNSELEQRVRERTVDLEQALAQIKTLSGLLPICASCKKIRDDRGCWEQIETYISKRSEAEFSHSICPVCARKMYGEFQKHK